MGECERMRALRQAGWNARAEGDEDRKRERERERERDGDVLPR
jgi:hypothetical protein